jgi:hypothetical protein
MTKLFSSARVLKVKILFDFLHTYCLAEKSASGKNVIFVGRYELKLVTCERCDPK